MNGKEFEYKILSIEDAKQGLQKGAYLLHIQSVFLQINSAL